MPWMLNSNREVIAERTGGRVGVTAVVHDRNIRFTISIHKNGKAFLSRVLNEHFLRQAPTYLPSPLKLTHVSLLEYL